MDRIAELLPLPPIAPAAARPLPAPRPPSSSPKKSSGYSGVELKERLLRTDTESWKWLTSDPDGKAASATALRNRFGMGWNHAKRIFAASRAHPTDLASALQMCDDIAASDAASKPSGKTKAKGPPGGKPKPKAKKTYDWMLMWALGQARRREPMSLPGISKKIGARFHTLDVNAVTYGRAIRKALAAAMKDGRVERVRSSYRISTKEIDRLHALEASKKAKEKKRMEDEKRKRAAIKERKAGLVNGKRARIEESTILKHAAGRKHRDANPFPRGCVPTGSFAGDDFGALVAAHASLVLFSKALDQPALAVGLHELLDAVRCSGDVQAAVQWRKRRAAAVAAQAAAAAAVEAAGVAPLTLAYKRAAEKAAARAAAKLVAIAAAAAAAAASAAGDPPPAGAAAALPPPPAAAALSSAGSAAAPVAPVPAPLPPLPVMSEAEALRLAAAEGLTIVKAPHTSTGFKGVSVVYHTRKPYLAQTRENGKRRSLGQYMSIAEAALTYARHLGPAGSAAAAVAAAAAASVRSANASRPPRPSAGKGKKRARKSSSSKAARVPPTPPPPLERIEGANALLARIHTSLLRVLLAAAARAEKRRKESHDSRRHEPERWRAPGELRWNLDLELSGATWSELLRLAVEEREATLRREARFIALAHDLVRIISSSSSFVVY